MSGVTGSVGGAASRSDRSTSGVRDSQRRPSCSRLPPCHHVMSSRKSVTAISRGNQLRWPNLVMLAVKNDRSITRNSSDTGASSKGWIHQRLRPIHSTRSTGQPQGHGAVLVNHPAEPRVRVGGAQGAPRRPWSSSRPTASALSEGAFWAMTWRNLPPWAARRGDCLLTSTWT